MEPAQETTNWGGSDRRFGELAKDAGKAEEMRAFLLRLSFASADRFALQRCGPDTTGRAPAFTSINSRCASVADPRQPHRGNIGSPTGLEGAGL